MDDKTRREFLRLGMTAAAAACAGGAVGFPAERAWGAADKLAAVAAWQSKVVIARDEALRAGGSVDSDRVLKLLDRGLQSFYGVDKPLEAWRKVVRPGEMVGLKVNTLGGRFLSTHVVLIEAITERLQQLGVDQNKIVVWDRFNSDLESGGFKIVERGPRRCVGNDLVGFAEKAESFGRVHSRLSKTLLECDAVINLPVLKDHGLTGMTAALKSMYGVIDNPNKCHGNGGDPYVADVNMLPTIRSKVRITICDAITAQYEGGPRGLPQWSWPYNGLLVSRDPVALDTIAWRIIDQKRLEVGLKSLADSNRPPTYIATAADAQHRLGVNDPNRIDCLEV